MSRAPRWTIALLWAGGCLPAQLNPMPDHPSLPEPQDKVDVAKPNVPPVQASDVTEKNARIKARELADELARDGQ